MGRGHVQTTEFRRGSSVLEYWLAHAEGFEVASRGPAHERVERVLIDPVAGRPTGLIVRPRVSRRRRRRLLPVDAVAAVDPFARRLHLERQQSPASARAAAILVALVGAAHRAGAALTRLGAASASGLLAACRWARPRLHRAGVLVGRSMRALSIAALEAFRWARPRVRACVVALGLGALALAAVAAEAGRRLGASAWNVGRRRLGNASLPFGRELRTAPSGTRARRPGRDRGESAPRA